MEYILINLDRSEDRLERMTQLFDKEVFTRFSAIDGKKVFRPTNKKISGFCKHFCSDGMIGCGLSHIYLWEKISKEPDSDKLYIILEDDIIIDLQNVKKNILIFIDILKNVDIIYLGEQQCLPSTKKLISTGINTNIYSAKKILTTYGYVINKKSAQKLINSIPIFYYHIDFVLAFNNQIKKAITYPYLVQTTGYSNSTMTNHFGKFLFKFLIQICPEIYYILTLPILHIGFDINIYFIVLVFLSFIFYKINDGFLYVILGLLISDFL